MSIYYKKPLGIVILSVYFLFSCQQIWARTCFQTISKKDFLPESFPVLFNIKIDPIVQNQLEVIREDQVQFTLRKAERLNHIYSPGTIIEIEGKKWKIKGIVNLTQNTNTYIVSDGSMEQILAQDGEIGVSGFHPQIIVEDQYLRIIPRPPNQEETLLTQNDIESMRLRLPGENLPGVQGRIVEILGSGIEGIVYLVQNDSNKFSTVKNFFLEGSAKDWTDSFRAIEKYNDYELPFQLNERNNLVTMKYIRGVSVENIYKSNHPLIEDLSEKIDTIIDTKYPFISSLWRQQAVLELDSGTVYLIDHR